MHFVAQPYGVAFATGSRLGIIGGDDAVLIADRWPIAPMHLLALLLVMLGEELAQQRHFGQLAYGLRGLRLIERRKQLGDILPHLLTQERAFGLGFGKAGQFKAMHVALKPLWVQVGAEPVGVLLGQGIERRAHALPDTFQAPLWHRCVACLLL